jgi:hypothetical protein
VKNEIIGHISFDISHLSIYESFGVFRYLLGLVGSLGQLQAVLEGLSQSKMKNVKSMIGFFTQFLPRSGTGLYGTGYRNLFLTQVQPEPASHQDWWTERGNRCLAYFETLIE